MRDPLVDEFRSTYGMITLTLYPFPIDCLMSLLILILPDRALFIHHTTLHYTTIQTKYYPGPSSHSFRLPCLPHSSRCLTGKSRHWGLCDLLGHVVAFCQDQHGSRFIQQRLEVCSDADKQLIFDEIIPLAHLLLTDVFGNYVLQKLFEYGSPEQCEALAELLSGQSVQLSMQVGTCQYMPSKSPFFTPWISIDTPSNTHPLSHFLSHL